MGSDPISDPISSEAPLGARVRDPDRDTVHDSWPRVCILWTGAALPADGWTCARLGACPQNAYARPRTLHGRSTWISPHRAPSFASIPGRMNSADILAVTSALT